MESAYTAPGQFPSENAGQIQHPGHLIPARIYGEQLTFGDLTQTKPDEEQRLLSIFMEIVETALLAVVIWLIVNFATARYVVEGVSMEPTFHTGQFLIVDKVTYRFFADPQRGDIVVFDYPGNIDDDYVKRIIGLPGDTVRIQDGLVYINDELLNETYLDVRTPGLYEEVIPDGYYWVMGDNRTSSSDSRSWGSLERQYIIGRAWVSYWPPKDWSFVTHHEYQPAGAVP